MSSYPQVQIGITGVPLEHQYQHIQRQLQNLLQQLRWSYVALWSLSHLAPPQTRFSSLSELKLNQLTPTVDGFGYL